jgi:hypothetical protein
MCDWRLTSAAAACARPPRIAASVSPEKIDPAASAATVPRREPSSGLICDQLDSPDNDLPDAGAIDSDLTDLIEFP